MYYTLEWCATEELLSNPVPQHVLATAGSSEALNEVTCIDPGFYREVCWQNEKLLSWKYVGRIHGMDELPDLINEMLTP